MISKSVRNSLAELVCVDPHRIQEFWPRVGPQLRKATRRTGLSAFAEIERDVFSGASLLWIAWNGFGIEAAASTSVQKTNVGMVCVITACAGANMANWVPLMRGIEPMPNRKAADAFASLVERAGCARSMDTSKPTQSSTSN